MKDSKNLVIGLLCAVVCIMAVAYAAFATTLEINGTATISSNWNVAITDINCEAHPVEGGVVEPGHTDENPTAVTMDFGTTTATFGMKFYQPGDWATCTVTITNGGSLDAKVKSIKTIVTDAAGNSSETEGSTLTLTSGAIKFELSGIAEGTLLPDTTNNTNSYVIKGTYVDTGDNQEQPAAADLSKTVTVTIGYEQDLSTGA